MVWEQPKFRVSPNGKCPHCGNDGMYFAETDDAELFQCNVCPEKFAVKK